MDGGLQPPADGHRLSHLHRVSRLHRRQQSLVPAGGQGQIDPPRGLLQLSDGLTPGILFVWGGIDPAEEGMKHEKTSKEVMDVEKSVLLHPLYQRRADTEVGPYILAERPRR